MRILISAVSRFSVPTGVCRVAANWLRCFQGAGNMEVSLAVGSWQAEYFATKLQVPAAQILVAENVQNSSFDRNLWYLTGLPKLARQKRFDVIHLGYPVPVLSRLMPVPTIGTVHDMFPYDQPDNFSFAFGNRLIFRLFAREVDSMICVSDQTVARLLVHKPRLPYRVEIRRVYNPLIFEDDASKLEKPATEIPERYLLVCAQHRKPKNIDIILKAFARLIAEEPKLQLILVGSDGSETAALKMLSVALGIDHRVKMMRSIPDSHLQYLYRHCAALVVASRDEGFCCPLIEALKESAPVVCSDIPVLREVGGDNCTYFSLQSDAEGNLTRAIVQALKQPRRQYEGLSRFTSTQIRHELSSLYQHAVLAGRRPRNTWVGWTGRMTRTKPRLQDE